MRLSEGKEIGIDAACGRMGNRKLFGTSHYIGIDIDEDRIQSGKQKYPEARAVLSSIEEATGLNGDVVVCVQTININRSFESKSAIPVVEKLVEMCNPGGYLIFNVGNIGGPPKDIEPSIDAVLNRRFERIHKRRYGAFDAKTRSVSSDTSMIIAYLMHLFPPFRTMFGFRYRRLYYCCKNRVTWLVHSE